ncbi:MAG: BMC domain-containing protein [Anaerocolumna sp.]
MKSFGFIEIPSVTAAIEALDIMCKTADVEFVTWERKLGGRLVTIIVQGDVSAVTQAIESAVCKAMKPCVHAVIPNPHEETIKMVNISASRLSKL